MNCINCQQEVTGQFCTHCGQRAGVKRITFKEGWIDFWSRIYGFDGMYPRTLRDLTLRPWKVTERYLEGNRVLYYGPVGYFFLMITLLLLVFSMIDLDLAEFLKGRQNMFKTEDMKGGALQQLTLQLVVNNYKLVAFLVVPFQAASARFFYFKKKGLNYMEHMVLPLYVFGHLYWISLLAGVLQRYAEWQAGVFTTVLTVLFVGYAYSAWSGGRWKGMLKGIAVYFTGMLLMIIFITLVTVATVWLLSWLSPDTFQQIRPSAS